MSDASINAGKYAGSGLGSFDVEVKKTPAKGKQIASDAVNTAKNTLGADLTIIDSAGNSSTHSLSIEKGVFTKPKPTASGYLTVENLTRGGKPDKNKPLTIDSDIAGKLGGNTAILVDENNKMTVINGDKNTVASNYLEDPTVNKVNAAYTVAQDDTFVNKKMALNVTNDLKRNFRSTLGASQEVSLMKDSQVKTSMNNLINEINTINRSTLQLEGQSKARTDKYNTDILKPQERLNKANTSWDNANKAEDLKIDTAKENLREAQYPGIHAAENDVDNAKKTVNTAKSNLEKAVEKVSSANSEVNRLEDLKVKGRQMMNENQRLESANQRIGYDLANYLMDRKSQLISLRSALYDKASQYDRLADEESRKPYPPQGSSGSPQTNDPFSGNKPSNGGSTSDPFSGNRPSGGSQTNDPFSNGNKPSNGGVSSDPFGSGNKPSTQKPINSDPFSNGNKPSGGSQTNDPFSNGNKPSSGSQTDDPFSNSNKSGQYRNDQLINEYRRRASDIRSDANYMETRIQGINNVISEVRMGGMSSTGFRFAVDRLSDGYNYKGYDHVFNDRDQGYNYFKGDRSDRNVIRENYIRPYDNNVSEIKDNNRKIEKGAAEYRNNIDKATQNLNNAKVAESEASGQLQGAQSRLTQSQAELDSINSKAPLTESNPKVKQTKTALDSAVKNKQNIVGENSPLTKEKVSAQNAVDSINSSYNNDIKDIDNKINQNNSQTLNLIEENKRKLGL